MFNNASNKFQKEDVVNVTDTTYTILNNTIHVMKTTAITDFTLPTISKIGDTFVIARMAPYRFNINHATSSQQIYIVGSTTMPTHSTAGLGHGVYSYENDAYIYKFYRFVCTVENTIWQACQQDPDLSLGIGGRILNTF